MAYEYAYLSTILFFVSQTFLFVYCCLDNLNYKNYFQVNSFIIVLSTVVKVVGYIFVLYNGEEYGLPTKHFIFNILIIVLYWAFLRFLNSVLNKETH